MTNPARIAAAFAFITTSTASAQEAVGTVAPDYPVTEVVETPPPGPPMIEPRFATPLVLPSPAQPLQRQEYWVRSYDYPVKASQEGRTGTTGFHVVVNEQGRVADCSVTASSGHLDLDEAACRAISRNAAFVPAFDREGNAVKGTFSNAVKWTIPEPPKRSSLARLKSYRFIKPTDYPLEAWRADEEGMVVYEVDLDAEGKALECRVIESSGSEILDAATCPIVMERAEFTPASSADGKTIPATYLGRHAWSKREPEFPNMKFGVRYILDENGEQVSCEVVRVEGDLPDNLRRDLERAQEKGENCPGPSSRGGIPYRDANGVPVAKQVTFNFDVVVTDPPEPAPADD